MVWSVTKCSVIGEDGEQVYQMGNEVVKKENKAVYLGMSINEKGLNAVLTMLRVKDARKRLRRFIRSFKTSGLSTRSKATLVRTFIRPMYEYGTHLIELSPGQLTRIDAVIDTAVGWCTGATKPKLVKRARAGLAFQSALVRRWRAAVNLRKRLLSQNEGRPYGKQVMKWRIDWRS